MVNDNVPCEVILVIELTDFISSFQNKASNDIFNLFTKSFENDLLGVIGYSENLTDELLKSKLTKE